MCTENEYMIIKLADENDLEMFKTMGKLKMKTSFVIFMCL